MRWAYFRRFSKTYPSSSLRSHLISCTWAYFQDYGTQTYICVDVCAHVCTHVHARVCDDVYLFTYLFARETFLLYMHAMFHNLVADDQP